MGAYIARAGVSNGRGELKDMYDEGSGGGGDSDDNGDDCRSFEGIRDKQLPRLNPLILFNFLSPTPLFPFPAETSPSL